jgi:hypothetical protein
VIVIDVACVPDGVGDSESVPSGAIDSKGGFVVLSCAAEAPHVPLDLTGACVRSRQCGAAFSAAEAPVRSVLS